MVPTSYQDIVDAINTEPKLRGKPKVVVFDCCQKATPAGDQLQLPKDMILARSTAFRTAAWGQAGVGNVYSKQLAASISSYAAAYSVEDLLKLTQGQVHGERIVTRDQHGVGTRHHQIAHVDSALGAYHLFLGDATSQ